MLKASKILERPRHTLNVWNYDKTLGESMHVLESKLKCLFVPENWYGHGCTGRTIAAGPVHMLCHFANYALCLLFVCIRGL